MTAARAGDFEALVAVLDPDVLMRADTGTGAGRVSRLIRGARHVAQQAVTFAAYAPFARPALVNGAPGIVTAPDGRLFSVMGFTVTGGKVTEINLLADPDRLAKLEWEALGD